MATVAATKTISFKAPYTGATFQSLTGLLMGRDGYLSGGLTTDNGATVTVQPTSFLQRGLVVQSQVAASGIPVPTAAEPWFLLAASPDDDPDSGATFTATADLATAAASVIVAVRSGGIWTNPTPVNVAAAGERDSDSGLEEDGGIFDTRSAAGVVDSIEGYKGLVVDPSGKRRTLRSIAANTAKALSQAPVRPNVAFDRNDHILLRQIEPYTPETRTIIGGAVAPHQSPITFETGAGVNRPSYFAKRGGAVGEQWWAWGNGINLKIKGGPAGEAFAIATLLSGTAIDYTYLAGQRASDGAVLLLYVDGANLRLVSFAAATGALVDAAVTLEALAGQISHVRAVLDRNEKLHIVFEHDEGARQQVYYAKVGVVTGGSFGVAEVAPQIVNGSDTGFNDTWPSIGVDRHGTVTVAYIRGAGVNEYGDLVVATLDQNGDLVSQDVSFAATDVAVDDGSPMSLGLPGRGAVTAAFLNVRKPVVVVTPHDETYVFSIGLRSGALPNYILAYNGQFEASYGSKLINVIPKLSTLFNFELMGLGADVGEAGEIFIGYKLNDSGAPETQIHFTSLATPLLQDGKIPVPLFSSSLDAPLEFAVSTDSFGDLHVRRGPLGEFLISYMVLTVAKSMQCAVYGEAAGYDIAKPGFARPQRHPKDLYLGTWTVPKSASATIDGHGKRFEVFNTRPKKMNYPIVVGKNGDYQGFNSIAEAVARAMRDGAGDIVLRNGIHRVQTGLTLWGGISMRGEGSATLISDSAAGFFTAGQGIFSSGSLTITGNVIQDNDDFLGDAVEGDIIKMATSGYHVVLRNLGRNPSNGFPRLLLENSIAGAPAGITADLYESGLRFENLTFILGVTSALPIHFNGCHRPTMRNIRMDGVTSGTAIKFNQCLDPMVDGADLSRVVPSAGTKVALGFTSSDGAVIRSAKFGDGKGSLQIDHSSQNAHLIDCTSDGADPAQIVFDFTGTRTTPIFMSSCEGRISASAATLAFLITNVGRRLRLPEGGGQLEFEDDNTRASSITDDGIKLSSATHKQFDGVSTDVITDAVNERVKGGGDTVTGVIIPNASGLDFGSASNRWDVFAQVADADKVLIDNTAKAGADRLVDLYASDSQSKPILAITGRKGYEGGVLINPPGFIQCRGPSIYEPMTNINATVETGFWPIIDPAGIAVVDSGLQLLTTATLNNSRSIRSHGQFVTPSNRPGFSCVFNMKTTATLRRDRFGWVDSPNPAFCVERDTSISDNFFLKYEGGTGQQTIDLGMAPFSDTTYFMSLIMIDNSPATFLWRIGNNPEWGTGTETVVFNDAVADSPFATSLYEFEFLCQTRTTAARDLRVAALHIFSEQFFVL